MSQVNLRIAATFTAEPVKDACSYLLETLGVPASIGFAPINQIFQELLSPHSSLAQNDTGVNVLLVRLEDLASLPREKDELQRNAQELAAAVREGVKKFRVPSLLVFCPASAGLRKDEDTSKWLEQIEQNLVVELESATGLYVIGSQELLKHSVADYDNPQGQRLASVPYTDRFYTVLGQQLTRRVYGLVSSPHKVIAIDCDQTLWKGVCGEDGPRGIELDPPRIFLQEFLRTEYESGMLLCLASKNNEPDVWEVFAERDDMVLKPEHIVTSRINWERKSENLKSLAHELQLGLDSFIFIDDDPVVCAEVEANCPQVLTICLPENVAEIPEFFRNHWAFDHLVATAEDSKRTAMYRENAERNQLLEQSISLTDFLESLDLRCEIAPAAAEHLPRVAQLTQRTNQFNATTIRRTEPEVQQLITDAGGNCLVVHVRDRFGDYGLVGALIYFVRDSFLEVDTFLLSCRALGRGVEHRMLSALGQIAAQDGLQNVIVNFAATEKNLPARSFLEGMGDSVNENGNGPRGFRYPTAVALEAKYSTDLKSAQAAASSEGVAPAAPANSSNRPKQSPASGLRRIALELHRPEALMNCLKRSETTRPELSVPYVAASNEVETALVGIWERILSINPVGVLDNFFELGGDSLIAVSLFVEVQEQFDKELPLATLFTSPTIRSLGCSIEGDDQAEQWRYLVPIQPLGNKEPLFCMHAAGGSVLFYRDLSQHLGDEQPVYGLQAREAEETGAYHNRVEDMAQHYLREIVTLQPEGPYYLCGSSFGGLIAYEVAQQLRASGNEIGLLALFDTYGPSYAQQLSDSKPLGGIVDRFTNLTGQLQRLNGRERAGFLKAKATKALTLARRKWIWKRNEFQIKYGQATGRALPKDIQRNHKAIQQALDSYEPQIYKGRLTLFRASIQPKGVVADPYLGWKELVAGEIDLYESPGLHGAMTVDPYAKSLAEQLSVCLEAAVTGETRSISNEPFAHRSSGIDARERLTQPVGSLT